jgi:hypothetical protein
VEVAGIHDHEGVLVGCHEWASRGQAGMLAGQRDDVSDSLPAANATERGGSS